jgi:sugar O-acyltransferase (sialic acid O-acetyltransferase NeuD family)
VSRVLVIGGADQGRQVLDAIAADGDHTPVGVLDRALEPGTLVAGVPVLGADVDLAARAAEVGADAFVVAIGDNAARGALLERSCGAAPGLTPATVVHPAAVVARDAVGGPGSILLAGCVVGNGTRLGRGVLVGIRASVDHDGDVADHASLGPGATTGGTVRIGHATAIGLGASVIHGVTVGEHTVVGAGAVVLEDLPAFVVAHGVPARVARTRQAGERYL